VRRKREENKRKKNLRRRNRQTKNIAVARKRRKWKSFCKNIRRHILGRYPGSRKRTGPNMFSNKMMSDVDMFRAS
jgi:hypothetical protein